MAHKLNVDNAIRPLRNVAALAALTKRVENRQWGLPGMAVFHGKTGLGKTFACAHVAMKMDAIYIGVQKMWTKKKLMTAVLRQLSLPQAGAQADLMERCNEGLAAAGRTLLIDEADYAVDRGMIEIIRDMHDGSSVPVILIGMENLPQKLKKWELVDGRVLAWVGAEPADLQDAKLLAEVYAEGIEIDDALITRILEVNKGSVRRISVDLAYVTEQSRNLGVKQMTLDAWGDAPFLRGEAPMPREGL